MMRGFCLPAILCMSSRVDSVQSDHTGTVLSVDVGGCGSSVTDQQRKRRNTLSVSTTGTTGEWPRTSFLSILT